MGDTSTIADKNGFQPGAWHFAALIAGNVALALGPWLVRLADTGPVASAFWRLFLPIPLIALLAWRQRSPGPIDKRLALLVVALTGTLWFILQGGDAAVGLRAVHAVAAHVFGWLLGAHVVAVSLHLVDLVRG